SRRRKSLETAPHASSCIPSGVQKIGAASLWLVRDWLLCIGRFKLTLNAVEVAYQTGPIYSREGIRCPQRTLTKRSLFDTRNFLNQGKLPAEEFLDPGLRLPPSGNPGCNDLASVSGWVAAGDDAAPHAGHYPGPRCEGGTGWCADSARMTLE